MSTIVRIYVTMVVSFAKHDMHTKFHRSISDQFHNLAVSAIGSGLTALFLLACGTPAFSDDTLSVRPGELCDTNLEIPPSSFAYQMRGDRCEGLYVAKVSSNLIQFASLTLGEISQATSAHDTLSLRWLAGEDSPVQLRARSLPARLYYRMDTLADNKAGGYDWPTDILRALEIDTSDIGVTAWQQKRCGSRILPTYLPILANLERDGPGGITVTLIPGIEFEEVYLKVAQVNCDTALSYRSVKTKQLNHGFYPARRPIRVRLRDPFPGGFYSFQFSAITLRGQPVASEFFVLVPDLQEDNH